jgi:dTDP-glucose 4,6-dehydratase
MKYENVLITGGAGFIGSNFIHYWLNKYPNSKIFNLDALTYAGNLENLKDVENNENYQFIQGDICDEELINKIIKENWIDLIVHFAAESHVDRSVLSSRDFIKTNVEGTMNLLDLALKNGKIRFHHVSTDEVFGHLGLNDKPFTEETPYDPRSPYSASKASSDHLVRAYSHTHQLPITISNCSNNYGPFQFPEKLIPLFITNLMEDKKVPIYGDGQNIRDWIHVDDHNKGVDLIIEKGKIGETYCLGGDNEKTNLEITNKILEILNKDQNSIEYVEDRKGHDRRYAIDFSKIKKELGWEPEIDFEDGLKKTVDWYKENQEWWKKIKSGEYQNYYNRQYKTNSAENSY